MTDLAGGEFEGSDEKLTATVRFYGLVDALTEKHGDATERMTWSRRGSQSGWIL